MKDKIQLIKKELERQIEEGKVKCQQSQKNNDHESFVAWSEHVATCGKLLVFIDSLPEEKKNYNERYERIAQTEQFKKSYCDKSLGKEEPVSDDLVEEILCRWEDDPHTLWPKCPYSDFKNIALHFANWQHGKDFDDLLQSEMKFTKEYYDKGHADTMNEMKEILRTEYEKGRFDMREDMMKDAISCNVDWYDGFRLDYTQEQQDDILLKLGADVGDKVKIIIVKEEQE